MLHNVPASEVGDANKRELGVAEPPPATRYLRRPEAAEYVRTTYNLPCSTKWMAKLACVGGGPRFRRAGAAVLYERPDLDEWAQGRIGPKVASTSELPRAA